jgi:hypothetical protein
MQKSRVIMDNRSAFRREWFGKVLQFGLEDAILPSSFLACPALARGRLGEKGGTPYALLAASAHCRSLEV